MNFYEMKLLFSERTKRKGVKGGGRKKGMKWCDLGNLGQDLRNKRHSKQSPRLEHSCSVKEQKEGSKEGKIKERKETRKGARGETV
jgi:hypothetical protein